MKGIVTVDDIVHVVEEEATEDIQKLGGVETLGEPYLAVTIPRMVRKRAGWLTALFLSEMLTATAMSYFEEEIARASCSRSRAAHHLERRQLRIASDYTGDPGDGARRSAPARLVESARSRSGDGTLPRAHPRHDRPGAYSPLAGSVPYVCEHIC